MEKLCAFLNSTRNNDLRQHGYDAGYANGYVAVPPEHPAYGKHFDDMYDLISIHGGLTFSVESDGCAKYWKNVEILNKEFKKIPKGWWVFGFDTLHCWDTEYNCNREYCIDETLNLKKQLEEMWNEEIQSI